MIEGKVLKDFNDVDNNLKQYTEGNKFKAENKRYRELETKRYVDKGKEIAKDDK